MPEAMDFEDTIKNFFKKKRTTDINLPNESGKVDPKLKKKNRGIFDKYNPFKAYGNAIDDAMEKDK